MALRSRHPGRLLRTLLLSVLLSVAAGSAPASAALSAGLGNLVLPSAPSSHAGSTVSGKAVLTVRDTTLYLISGLGTGSGWNVTVQATDLAYSGPNHGTALRAQNLAVTATDPPAASTGSQPVDPVHGPKAPVLPAAASLDVARKVLQADARYGAGTYTQGITLSLTIPPDTRVGTYTATITTTITSGP